MTEGGDPADAARPETPSIRQPDISLASPWPSGALATMLTSTRKLVPLVGAGVSHGAGLPLGTGLASWMLEQPFAQGLDLSELAHGNETNPLLVSTAILRANSLLNQTLQTELRERIRWLCDHAPRTPMIDALAGTPGGLVLTLNYDDLIERAAEEDGHDCQSLTLDQMDLRALMSDDGTLRVLHLHGSIRDAFTPLVIDQGKYAHHAADGYVAELFASLTATSRTLCILGSTFAEEYLRPLLSRHAGASPGHLFVCPAPTAQLVDSNADTAPLRRLVHGVQTIAFPDQEFEVLEPFVERLLARTTTAPAAEGVRAPETRGYAARVLVERAHSEDPRDDEPFWFGRRSLQEDELRAVPRALVVGAAGTGKSELLKQLARHPLEGEASALVELRSLPAPVGRPDGLLRSWLALAQEGPAPIDADAVVSGEQRLHLLLDGLDDARSAVRRPLLRALDRILEAHPLLRVTLSSRPLGVLDGLSDPWRRFELDCDEAWLDRFLALREDGAEARARLDALPPALRSLRTVPFYASRLVDLPAARVAQAATAEGPLELILWLLQEQIAQDPRLLALDEAAGRWLGGVALTMQLTGVRHLGSGAMRHLAEPLGLDDLDELVDSLEGRALIEHADEHVVFGHRLFADALVADRLRGERPADWLDVVMPQTYAGRTLRDDWLAALDLLMRASPPWRQAIGEHDAAAAARATPITAPVDERQASARALWESVGRDRVWLNTVFAQGQDTDADRLGALIAAGGLEEERAAIEDALRPPASRYDRANALDVLLRAQPSRAEELVGRCLSEETDSTVRRNAASWASRLELGGALEAIIARAMGPEDEAEADDMTSIALRLSPQSDRVGLGLELLRAGHTRVHDHHVLEGASGLAVFRWYAARIRRERAADEHRFSMPVRDLDEHLEGLGELDEPEQVEVGEALALAKARGDRVNDWLLGHPAAVRGYANCLDAREGYFFEFEEQLAGFDSEVLLSNGIEGEVVEWLERSRAQRAEPVESEPAEQLELDEDERPWTPPHARHRDLSWILDQPDPELLHHLAHHTSRPRGALDGQRQLQGRLAEALHRLWGEQDLRDGVDDASNRAAAWAVAVLMHAPTVDLQLTDERWEQAAQVAWWGTSVTEWVAGQATPERINAASASIPADTRHLAAMVAICGDQIPVATARRLDDIETDAEPDVHAQLLVERLAQLGRADLFRNLSERLAGWRPIVDPALAALGDLPAQRRALTAVVSGAQAGALPDAYELTWLEALGDQRHVADLEALVRLAHPLEQSTPRSVSNTALNALVRIGGCEAHAALSRMVDEPAWEGAQWLAERRDALAQREATRVAQSASLEVLERLHLPTSD